MTPVIDEWSRHVYDVDSAVSRTGTLCAPGASWPRSVPSSITRWCTRVSSLTQISVSPITAVSGFGTYAPGPNDETMLTITGSAPAPGAGGAGTGAGAGTGGGPGAGPGTG